MAKIWSQESWTGGQSAGSRIGYKNSYDDGIGIDFRTDPDKLTTLRKLTKESGSVVLGLIKWMTEYEGTVYMHDNGGRIYSRNPSAAYTLLRTVSGSSGQGLGLFGTLNADYGWYAGGAQLGRIAGLSGSEGFDDNYLRTMQYNRYLYNDEGIASSYTPLTSINEAADHRFSFVATKASMYGFDIYFAAKGTGTVTVTLHDANNTIIATSSLTAGQRGDNAGNNFEFSSKTFYLVVGGSYHIHVTSTVSDGAIGTGTTGQLEEAQIGVYTRPLETDARYHPMKVFTNLLCIGNGRFLATLDDSEVWDNERLTFPKGEKVRCLETIGSYIAISTWKGDTIDLYGRSRIYFWDGVSPTYNDFIDIDGQVAAMSYMGNNKLAIIHGTEGRLSIYTGGITPKRKLKNIGKNKIVDVLPGAISVLENILYFGLGFISGSAGSTVDRVIYGYGTMDNDYPNSLTKDFIISTGNYGWDNSLSRGIVIGSILGIAADKLFVSWQDSTSGSTIYGVDILDTSTDQTTSFVDSLRIDGGNIDHEKKGTSINVVCQPLISGQKIEVYTKLDQAAAGYTSLGDISFATDGAAIYKSFPIDPRWFEMQIRLKLYSASGVSPTVLSVSVDMEIYKQQQGGGRKAGNL